MKRIIPAEPTAEQIERGLKAPIPGGSQAWHWFLPHDTTPQGAANVRDVLRRMFLAMTENCPEVSGEPVAWKCEMAQEDGTVRTMFVAQDPDGLRFNDMGEPSPFRVTPLYTTPQPDPVDDPMDTPLPCDVKVGHGTIRKGVKLRTLVARMKVLYEMATGEKADAVAALTDAQREERLALFRADLAAGCKPVTRSTSTPPAPRDAEIAPAMAMKSLVESLTTQGFSVTLYAHRGKEHHGFTTGDQAPVIAGLFRERDSLDAEIARLRDAAKVALEALESIGSMYDYEASVGDLASRLYEARCIANPSITTLKGALE